MRDIDPKYKVSWLEEIRANIRGILLIVRSSPLFVVGMMATTAFQGLLPAAIVFQTGRFLNLVQAASVQGIASQAGIQARNALIGIGVAILLSQIIGPVQEAALFGLGRRFHAFLTRKMMTSVAELPGVAYFEDPNFRDKLKVSEWIGWAPVNSLQALSQGWQQLSTLIGFAVVATTFAKWVPLIVIGAAIPAGVASVTLEAAIGLARWRHSPEIRKADYYRDLTLKLEPSKEVRIFGLKDWMLDRQGGHWYEGVKDAWAKRRRGMGLRLGLQAPAIAAMAYAFMKMLDSAAHGRIRIGTFGQASAATVGMATAVIALFQAASWMRRSNFYLPVAFQIMDLRRIDPRLDIKGVLSAKQTTPTGIRFENVTFQYPTTERKILDNLDLWIPDGESIALVGENGAGKTTMIKLLCRFYDPTDGRILVDGVDIREFDLASLRSRLAVIFQDFVKYKLPAKDNVGFGAVDNMQHDLMAESARRVGVLEKIESLPQGWDTPLARDFDGVDLSGGEWQRVALARAMMAQVGREANILILDEPTASLDVRLEHELYEHFAELSGGKTTLLVSHRFSTVRMAERIIFLEKGKIVEDGTHEQLMSDDGRYAALYEMQASHFRLTGELD